MPFKAHIDTLICRSRWLLILALTAVAAPPALADWNTQPEDIAQHPTWIYTPSRAMPDGKHPLLVVLHGCDQTHDQIKTFGNLVPTAEANGIVVAVPSVGNEFFGPGCWDYDLAQDHKQHMSELVTLANTLKSRQSLNIDRNHVYIVGLSSGAAMALAVGCKAPDVFAGVGAVAGPSVGSSQNNALADAVAIPANNIPNAINSCKSLAGPNVSSLDTQIASIAFGDMDRNGPRARFGQFDMTHAGQLALISIKWSQDNVEVLRNIYGTGTLEPEKLVQNGLGVVRTAKKDNKARLSLTVVRNVGHAWPAGAGNPNSFSQGGKWIAQSGMNYPEFIVDWLISNNMRVPSRIGSPAVVLNASVNNADITASGTATDADGSVIDMDTTLLKADTAGTFQQSDSHVGIPLGPNGSYTDKYVALPGGWYKVQATARDNSSNISSQVSPEIKIGSPPPLVPCHDFRDTNFGHVQKGRAFICSFGFTCAKGSNENLGLFNVAITTSLIEESSGSFRKGVCPI